MASVEELAAVLGVGLNQAYAAVQMGQVPAVRFGRRWLISRKTIDRIANGVSSRHHRRLRISTTRPARKCSGAPPMQPEEMAIEKQMPKTNERLEKRNDRHV